MLMETEAKTSRLGVLKFPGSLVLSSLQTQAQQKKRNEKRKLHPRNRRLQLFAWSSLRTRSPAPEAPNLQPCASKPSTLEGPKTPNLKLAPGRLRNSAACLVMFGEDRQTCWHARHSRRRGSSGSRRGSRSGNGSGSGCGGGSCHNCCCWRRRRRRSGHITSSGHVCS